MPKIPKRAPPTVSGDVITDITHEPDGWHMKVDDGHIIVVRRLIFIHPGRFEANGRVYRDGLTPLRRKALDRALTAELSAR